MPQLVNYRLKKSEDAMNEMRVETLCSGAIERIARLVGVPVDLDDPEPALVAAVERAVAALVKRAGTLQS